MNKKNLLWGGALILSGFAIVADQLGYLGDINLFTTGIGVILGLIAIKNLFKLKFGGVLFPLAFIGILFDEQLGITAITPWTILFAATLLTIGFSLIFKPKKKSWKYEFESKKNNFENIEGGNSMKLSTKFGSSTKYVNTNNFEYGNIECSFGAMEVYFDKAIMNGENATLNLDIKFGGVEIYLPKTWRVRNSVSVSIGAVEEGHSNSDVFTNTLILTGDVQFAGVEIKFI
ncbi:MAG: LiaF transmembrane domain-containing protein [Clostridium sp.]